MKRRRKAVIGSKSVTFMALISCHPYRLAHTGRLCHRHKCRYPDFTFSSSQSLAGTKRPKKCSHSQLGLDSPTRLRCRTYLGSAYPKTKPTNSRAIGQNLLKQSADIDVTVAISARLGGVVSVDATSPADEEMMT
ncbi:hypothetical protein LSAT2_032439 [Lamellibrachia satsuma]|nr:hypothetical protein LSAT2_032439 [Lamellibrachia satsuma]